jgi:sporulation protein YabP
MEKNNSSLEKNKIIENLSLTNRKNLKLDGIVEIMSSSETQLNIKLKDTSVVIFGQNMHIVKLDIETGILEVDGLIECIKYGKSGNIFKRIFK